MSAPRFIVLAMMLAPASALADSVMREAIAGFEVLAKPELCAADSVSETVIHLANQALPVNLGVSDVACRDVVVRKAAATEDKWTVSCDEDQLISPEMAAFQALKPMLSLSGTIHICASLWSYGYEFTDVEATLSLGNDDHDIADALAAARISYDLRGPSEAREIRYLKDEKGVVFSEVKLAALDMDLDCLELPPLKPDDAPAWGSADLRLILVDDPACNAGICPTEEIRDIELLQPYGPSNAVACGPGKPEVLRVGSP